MNANMSKTLLVVAGLSMAARPALGDVTLPNTSTIADIQAAIDGAEPGAVITLEDGTYAFDQTLTVANGVTLTGSHRDKCILAGVDSKSLATALIINNKDACVRNLTVSNITSTADWTYYGAGVRLYAGLLTAARVTGCTVKGQNRTAGVSMEGTTLGVAAMTYCIIDHNTATKNGGHGGVRFMSCGGTMANCLVWANTGIGAGGISVATGSAKSVWIVNCTVSGNTGGTGGGLGLENPGIGSSIVNTIVSGNTASAGSDIYFGNDSSKSTGYNCLCPTVSYGVNPQTKDPLFVSPGTGDFRLQSGSPAHNTGDKDKAKAVLGYDLEGTLDLYGLDRVLEDQVEIGCAEFDPYQVACSIAKDRESVLVGDAVTLTASSSGFGEADDIVYTWKILQEGGDEPFVTNGAVIVLRPTEFGTCSVGLTASSEQVEKSAVAVPTSFFVAPKTVYVTNEENPDSAFPYAEPRTAATSLNAALEAAEKGATVKVCEGTNRVSATVLIPEGVSVVGAGRDKTTIYADCAFDTVVRINGQGAVLKDLTVAHGRMTTRWGYFGSGVEIGGNGGTMADCRVTDCGVNARAEGLAGVVKLMGPDAVVARCLVDGNTAADSRGNTTCGGIYATAGRVENSVITNNVGKVYGEAKSSGLYLNGAVTVLNCTVLDNRMPSGEFGGGVHVANGSARVRNCIIDGNLNGDDSETNYLGNGAAYSYCLSSDAAPAGSIGCVVGRPVYRPGSLTLAAGSLGRNKGSVVGYEDILFNGKDFYGNRRVKSSRRSAKAKIDIGCAESDPDGLTVLVK